MKAELLTCLKITDSLNHNAFTSLAVWKNDTYVAYRHAQSHAIQPGGVIHLQRASGRQWDNKMAWQHAGILSGAFHAPECIDYRDPKLIATQDVLYCLVGAYTPKYPATTLQPYPGDNLLQSYVAYTYDGDAWSPFHPVGRPNYWLWSLIPTRHAWYAAAYHTGVIADTSSLHLFSGVNPLHLSPAGVIYDGANMSNMQQVFEYPNYRPSEPVLVVGNHQNFLCYARTSTTMNIGVAPFHAHQPWRWHNTDLLFHPSAALVTNHGTIVAGREITEYQVRGVERSTFSTALYAMHGQEVEPLLALPSGFDTGYAGLDYGNADELLVSWYSQHEPCVSSAGAPLPGASIFVGRVKIIESA